MYTLYLRHFWQGNRQIYGHIPCLYMRFFGRILAKYTVIYGVYIHVSGQPYTNRHNPTRFWPALHISGQPYTFLANPTKIAKYTIVYMVHIYAIFWQDNRQIYGHIHGAYTHVSGQPHTSTQPFWPALHVFVQPYANHQLHGHIHGAYTHNSGQPYVYVYM